VSKGHGYPQEKEEEQQHKGLVACQMHLLLADIQKLSFTLWTLH
jgi:hypothetical protein